MKISTIREVEKFCQTHYDEKTYQHVQRVADYVLENPVFLEMKEWVQTVTYAAALLHDIIEDVPEVKAKAFNILNELDPFKTIGVGILTALSKGENETYIQYIERLKQTSGTIPREIVYVVKLADMKDHLMQKDTLTDRLKEKYWEALPYLL